MTGGISAGFVDSGTGAAAGAATVATGAAAANDAATVAAGAAAAAGAATVAANFLVTCVVFLSGAPVHLRSGLLLG